MNTLSGFNGVSSNYTIQPTHSGLYSTMTESAVSISNGTNGKMTVSVPLEVNGRDVMRELDELRDAVLLLKRHVDMESKYPKLKELKEAYEAQLEKYKTWEALK